MVSGAYARIRKQFGLSIGRFEGVEEALARIAGNTYAMTALSQATAAAVDRGEKPAVPSAIAKYHCTEMAREVARDAMDIHGGKGVILGPRNYLGRGWQAAPISITVEGANIMTRIADDLRPGRDPLPSVGAQGNAGGAESGSGRAPARFRHQPVRAHRLRDLQRGAQLVLRPDHRASSARRRAMPTRSRYFRKLNRYSANLALLADTSMLLLGGKLKFKEKLSGRLGDVLSQLYIASAMLKRYEDDGRPATEQPLLAWAFHDSVHKIELAMSGVLRNFPIRRAAWLLWPLVFPLGRRAQAPSDRLGHRAAALLMSPSRRARSPRRRRVPDALREQPGRPHQRRLAKVILAEPVERKFLKALKNSDIEALTFPEQLTEGVREGWITAEETRAARATARADLGRDHGRRFRSAPNSESASLHRPQHGLPRRVTTPIGRDRCCRMWQRMHALARRRLAVLARGLLQGALLRHHLAALHCGSSRAAAKRGCRDRRAVHNHIGTRACDRAVQPGRTCAGVMTDASLPRGMRWIPKGMSVHYLKKAHGTLRRHRDAGDPDRGRADGYELPVHVEVLRRGGERCSTRRSRCGSVRAPARYGDAGAPRCGAELLVEVRGRLDRAAVGKPDPVGLPVSEDRWRSSG